MKILIVGAGIVGFNLAEELSQEGHDISIVDRDVDQIKLISEKLDVLAVAGNACLPTVLKAAKIRDVEMVIAVTDKDEINLMVCALADKFKVKQRIARLRHMEFTSERPVFSLQELHVDQAINPRKIIIEFILKILKTPGAVNVADFAGGEILLRGFDVPENAPLAGKTIGELQDISDFNSFLIVAIVRAGELIIPKFENEICVGDKVYMMVDKEFLPLVLPMVNKTADVVRKVVIFGANRLAVNLAKELEAMGVGDISILEPDLRKANSAADELSKSMVLHGAGTDLHLHYDVNMDQADFFMALSDDDEDNILASVLAKKHGAKRAVVVTNDPEYLPILDSIGIDVAVNPRLITVGVILQRLRKSKVSSVFKLVEGEAEVLEIMLDEKSKCTGRKINQLGFPKDAIIGAIVRKKSMIVPRGDTLLEAQDTVVLVTLPSAIGKVEKIFSQKTFF